MDSNYLKALQIQFKDQCGEFCGYGVYTDLLQSPVVDWDENHTYIQEKGINQDFGLFDTPDEFYQQYGQKMGLLKKILFQYIARQQMNRTVEQISNLKIL